MNRIFVDIETLPCENPADAPAVKAPANYKDQEKIEKYIAEHSADAYRATALDPLVGRILCIGYAFDDAAPQVLWGSDALERFEREIDLYRSQNRWAPLHWVGHNLAFDLGFLYLHAARAGLQKLCRSIPWFPYQRAYFHDTMAMAAGPGRDRVSLDRLAKFFGVGQKDGLKGSEVFDAYLNGQIQQIAEYCANDVDLTRRVWRKLETYREEEQ